MPDAQDVVFLGIILPDAASFVIITGKYGIALVRDLNESILIFDDPPGSFFCYIEVVERLKL